MTDDIERQLEELGRSTVPPVDGAYANRLESSLRQQLASSDDRRAGVSWLRPGVLVLGAVAALVAGALLFADSDPDVGFADGGSTTTIPAETTTVAPTSQPSTTEPTTSEPPSSDGSTTVPIETTVAPTTAPNTTTPETTIPQTTVPETTVPETTIPAPSVDLTLRRSDRAIVASWTIDRDVPDVAGWVLIRSLDGDGDRVATSRDPGTRRLLTTITDLDQTFRVEGLNEDGLVLVASADVPAP